MESLDSPVTPTTASAIVEFQRLSAQSELVLSQEADSVNQTSEPKSHSNGNRKDSQSKRLSSAEGLEASRISETGCNIKRSDSDMESNSQSTKAEEYIPKAHKLRSNRLEHSDKYLDWTDQSYPCWSSTPTMPVPVTVEEISSIFGRLKELFGFQEDSMCNMFDHFMVQLDSRASRMGTDLALITLHADYIGGEHSNYRKWYFASGMASDDHEHGWLNDSKDLRNASSPIYKFAQENENQHCTGINMRQFEEPAPESPHGFSAAVDLFQLHHDKMARMTASERVADIALYLLCWGEANQIRFMPECLDFIYKCALDRYKYMMLYSSSFVPAGEYEFLNDVISPLYNYYSSQLNTTKDADHKDVIGYDDMNQFFWHIDELNKIRTYEGDYVMDIVPWERYGLLCQIIWDNVFYKTFRETRSWLHLVVNFNRIWILHLAVFWFYTAANVPSLYTTNYNFRIDNQPPTHLRWTIIAIGGAFGPLINIVATLAEASFIPRNYPGAQNILLRLVGYLTTLALIVAPTIYILLYTPLNEPHTLGTTLAIIQMILSVVTVIICTVTPLGLMVRRKQSERVFLGFFHGLSGNDRIISWGIWVCIFAAKLTESYFFLTLSLRDPVRELNILPLDHCIGAQYIGKMVCLQQARIVLALLLLTDLVLFFLDTYLWYVIFNTIFSISRSFYLGASIWAPWRNIYCRLPRRIFSKIMYAQQIHKTDQAKYMVSQVWNAIIVSMFREHLLPLEQVRKLVYNHGVSEQGDDLLYEPPFFVSQQDSSFHTSLIESQSEAERRISFFAQSLSTPIPEPLPVESMPTFTVLIPHYNEKIILSLKETIREKDGDSKISLLEYLKELHTLEWDCFVKDSMGVASDDSEIPKIFEENSNSVSKIKGKPHSLPFYCIGFKSSSPEFILRTRLWASLRTQTLYRTISGFMNYPRAIKLMYSIESLDHLLKGNIPQYKLQMEKELNDMARRKFRIVTAMQHMTEFSPESIQDKEMMLRAYPELHIAYLQKEFDEKSGEIFYYSCLINGSCRLLENGHREPKYRVRLSGDPILGDGKSDNQNNALIFYRGEYIQLVDANQDNYLEECLKIRSVLAEFEEIDMDTSPYDQSTDSKVSEQGRSPVAMLGAREYIFSENIGVLGDVAAGKEQTFGTLFARTLAKIGGKLHYGHPDFLNAIFMTTRGGVSKAQKGLHLNEDIYAGICAILRGGRIKHCEYSQCGKGRDLGFGSILNFTTKLGCGMGEQMLSREYFYLGSLLPLDRFLSFYYAHPGFHINNVFIVISLELFLVVSLNLAALAREAVICDYSNEKSITEEHLPLGCQNLIPIFHWVKRCVLSIVIVFFISFLPLFVQELTERGAMKSVTRLTKHVFSLSPIFEVFVCQIYAHSLAEDLIIGGARYIPTGRGFATTRLPFTSLYNRFGFTSIYFGSKLLLILIFVSSTMWSVSLLWFWLTTIALCWAPFIFNPHQFSLVDFFIDYRRLWKWMLRGNDRYNIDSWVGYHRLIRTRLTGFKQKAHHIGIDRSVLDNSNPKPNRINILIFEVLGSLLSACILMVPYLYVNSQSNLSGQDPTNPLLRLAIVTLGPITLNFITLLISFITSIVVHWTLKIKWEVSPQIIAAVVHGIAIFNHIIFYELMWLLESWNFPNALLGSIAALMVQSFLFRSVHALGLSREYRNGHINLVFWSGSWIESQLKWHTLSQPFREMACKTVEMSMFAMDFVLCHFLLFAQTPLVFIPYIDRAHTTMLYWLIARREFRSPIALTKSARRARKRVLPRYLVIYFSVMLGFIAVFLGPIFIPTSLKMLLSKLVDTVIPGIVQPSMMRAAET